MNVQTPRGQIQAVTGYISPSALGPSLMHEHQCAYPMSDIDMPNDGARVTMIRLLMNRGYRANVLISHDICTRTRLSRYGGHGYQHIFANVIPRMLRRGFTQAEIDMLMIANPRC